MISMNKQKSSRMQIKGAKELLRLGHKVLAYRNDLMQDKEKEILEDGINGLKSVMKSRPVYAEELEESARVMNDALQKFGGVYYHKKSWVENVEMLLVAAIVVIGIRSFFVQPFIIPTNSMFPSFYGMQPKVYDSTDTPNLFERSLDKVLLGASHYKLEAQSSGNIYLKIQNGQSFRFAKASFPNGKFFVFPTTVREYIFEIGGKDHVLQVPAEFDLDELLAMKFAGIENLRDLPLIVSQDHGFSGKRLKLSDTQIRENTVALAFDILLGDALFVDRMSYNFVSPRTGDPAVFRTGSIDDFNRQLRVPIKSLIGEDKYYIKRLVGEPGDTLEMRVPESIFTNGTDVRKGVPGILYRNGKELDNRKAFQGNLKRTKQYSLNPDSKNPSKFPGYRAEGLLTNRQILVVPDKNSSTNKTGKNAYFAMGDNSTDSLDGRMWGFVPENEIIGRALLVYYPFTSRWGLSD